ELIMKRLSLPAVNGCGECIGQFGSFPACKAANDLEPLRPSKEHYIVAVYELQKKNMGVRITDIALMTDVSKPSAVTAIQELQRRNLVTQRQYGRVYLTEKGLLQALIVQCKYATIKRFLTDFVGVSEQTAALDAGEIVHLIGNETVEVFNRALSAVPKGVGKKGL
ncbi:MAG: metal-dependent transcriptional regulator, partial [Coriobacteriales bacterium]|nr:metal-dependent transcriptional regulator [Coriobacteriales bacterium]